MKKIITLLLVAIVMTVGLWAQDAKELVKKCVDTIGGEEAVQKYMDFSAEGKMIISVRMMELSGQLKTIQKQRKSWTKAKVVFGSNEFVSIQAYDGQKAWMEQMGMIADQPSLNSETALDHAITLLIQKDAEFSTAKETEIEGKKVIGVIVKYKGKETTFYIDPEANTVVEMVYKDYFFGQNETKELVERRIRYSDYKNIGGVLFPMKHTAFDKGKKLIEMTFEKVTFSPDVSADIFNRPDRKPDLRYMEEMLY